MARIATNRGQAIADAALPVGTLAAFAVAAVSASVAGRLLDEIVLGVLVLTVGAVALAAGRLSAVLTAVTAALSFDFFRVEPIRILHAGTLVASFAGLAAVAILASRRVAA
jgi:K+-sensing histidine kinase KdpD